MARTELTHKTISRAGAALTADTAADTVNGNETVNDERVFVLANNTDVAAQTVTFVIPGSVDAQDIPDRSESLAAGATEAFGPFPGQHYGRLLGIDCSSNLVNLSVYHLS